MKLSLIIFLTLGLFWACSEQGEVSKPIKIATNPWPGNEFLHLAEELGIFEQLGLNIDLVQLGSLSDAQQAYIRGHTQGLATSLIEVLQVPHLGGAPLQVVLLPDYSNGGDVILANSQINSVSDLRGQKVGVEVSSLGIYILARALHKYGMSISDVELVHVDQNAGGALLTYGQIDAFVTYPPVSIQLEKQQEIQQIFNTSEIPYEILDTVAIAKSTLLNHPGLVTKLRQAWQLALEYSHRHPNQAFQFMAARERLSPKEFKTALTGVELLDIQQQTQLLSEQDKLSALASQVCQLLVELDNIQTSCNDFSQLFYP